MRRKNVDSMFTVISRALVPTLFFFCDLVPTLSTYICDRFYILGGGSLLLSFLFLFIYLFCVCVCVCVFGCIKIVEKLENNIVTFKKG